MSRVLRCIRVDLFIAFAGLTMAMARPCPTGQAHCDAAGTTEATMAAGICILACGVVLPPGQLLGPGTQDRVSMLSPLPVHAEDGLQPEPSLPPPRRTA
jgi:hypothetical protein